MLNSSQSLVDRCISFICLVFLLLLYVQAMLLLPVCPNLPGVILQQVFVAALLFIRVRRKAVLPFIPDEFLMALPYLWATSVFGKTSDWSVGFILPVLAVFSLSLFHVTDGKNGFAGGLTRNSQLQGVFFSLIFVLLMAMFLLKVLPPFTLESYQRVILNLFVFGAGLPVSLSALYRRLSIHQ